jgi:Amt family ammonium transporter
MLGWLAVERVRSGKPTTLGALGCRLRPRRHHPRRGYVPPLASLVIGAAAGAHVRPRRHAEDWLGYDDSLDVVGVHLVAGVIGSL